MNNDGDGLLGLCDRVVAMARSAGADVAEAVARAGSQLSVKVRMGETELVRQADSAAIGLRVMRGQRVAVVGSSDVSDAGLQKLVMDAVELAALTEPDAFAGPPEASLLADPTQLPALDLVDTRVSKIDAQEAIRRARLGEQAAFAFDGRINRSEGGSFGRTEGLSAIVTTGGFRGLYEGTFASLSVRPVMDETTEKKCNASAWTAARYLTDLEDEATIGARAAARLIAKLGATKVDTQEVPVIFDRDMAGGMLGLFGGCILGSSIWRRSSYLLDREQTRVASSLVTVVDDPLILRGPGSRPFDGEGLPSRRHTVVDGGMLNMFLLDTYSARKLGRQSTGHASRGGSGGVSPGASNFFMANGTETPEAIVAGTKRGLYVTEMMGFGFNAVTGDFSRGAAGYWIENGEKTHPVSEVTISLNLDQILQRIDAVGNDLELRSSVAAPTFRVSAMMVAGR